MTTISGFSQRVGRALIPGGVVGEHKVPGNLKPTDTLLSVVQIAAGPPPTGTDRTAEFSIHATKGGVITNTTTNTSGGWLLVAWASTE